MTEQQRRQICAELARRMGYTTTQAGRLNGYYGLLLPSGEDVRGSLNCPTSDECFLRFSPDLFADAAAKDALVAWLAADDARWRNFTYVLWSFLPTDFNYDYIKAFALMPCETITLAAARALGIQEAEDE